jgi:TPR repeat protein
LREELRRFVDKVEAHDTDEAEAWVKARLASNDADAQFLMGLLVIHSPGGDFREACAWYERAAAQDHPEALYELSRIDQSETRANWGPPINDRMRERLHRAAELGSLRACATVGQLHVSGRGGLPEDERQAERWLRKAAEGGDVDGEVGLASLLLKRADTSAVDEGLSWLGRVASREGSDRMWEAYRAKEALKDLVQIHERGHRSIPADPAKAAAYLQRLKAFGTRLEEKRKRLHELAAAEGIDLSRPRIGATSAQSPDQSRPHAYEDADEAMAVLRGHMAAYRAQSHRDLAGLVNKRLTAQLRGPSDRIYEVVVEVRWDDQPLGDVHVAGTVNDQGWRACEDIYEIFTMSPASGIVGDSVW